MKKKATHVLSKARGNLTFYQFLEVEPSISQEDLKKSYLRLAKKYHPDVNGGNDSTFKILQIVWDRLKTPKDREEYDYDVGLKQRPNSGFTVTFHFGGGSGNSTTTGWETWY